MYAYVSVYFKPYITSEIHLEVTDRVDDLIGMIIF